MHQHGDEYLLRIRGRLEPTTYANHRVTVLRFASWWDSTRKVPLNLHEADVDRYIWGVHECLPGCRGREHRGPGLRATLGDASLNRTLGQLERFLTWGFQQGHTRGDAIQPCTKRIRQRRQRRMQLELDQLRRLYEGAEDPYERMICALAVYTGGRGGELKTLRVGDVDLGRGEIAWERHKTRQDDDSLPIMEELEAELRRWLAFYELEAGPPQPGWLLIPARRSVGNPGVIRYYPERQRARGLYIVVKKHLARVLEVPEAALTGEGVHTARRSIARCLYEQMCNDRHPDPVSVVQALLGHSSRMMTERYIGVETGRRERDRLLRGRSMFSRE